LFLLQLLLLENVRFYKEEEKNVAEFAQKVRSEQSISWGPL
jgi:3-phosphoglycerate kinase